MTHHVPVGNFTTPRWASEARGGRVIKTRVAPTMTLLGEARCWPQEQAVGGLAIIKLAQRGMPSPLICDTHDSTLSSVMSFSLSSSNGRPRNFSPRTLFEDWCWYGL